MFATRPGRGRISRNPFVRIEADVYRGAGDTLARVLDSDATSGLLRVLLLLFLIDLALGATLALSGS